MAYTTAQLLSALLTVDGRAAEGGVVELPPNARLLLDVIVGGAGTGDTPTAAEVAQVINTLDSGARAAVIDAITATDADAGSALRVQQDARHSATIAAEQTGLDFAPITEAAESVVTGVRPIGSLAGVAYGTHNSTGGLYRSTDGTAWTQVTAFTGTARSIFDAGDGEVIVNGDSTLLKSSGWTANPITATFSTVLTSAGSGTGFLDCSVDTYDNIVIAAQYGSTYVNARYVYVSTDHGATFSSVLDLNTLYPSDTATTHWHSVAIDPWHDGPNPRLYAAHGDGPRGVYYSDDLGASWTLLRNDWQPMPMIATEAGIVTSTDANDPDGVWLIPRADPSTRVQLYRMDGSYWSGVLLGFGVSARRDDATGLIYIAFRGEFHAATGEPQGARLFVTDGYRAGEVYETDDKATAAGQRVDPNPPTFVGDEVLFSYSDSDTTTRRLVRAPKVKRGLVPIAELDSGNALSGASEDRNSIGIGRATEARGRSVVIGSEATLDAASVFPEAVVVGEGAAASSSGVAIGRAATTGTSASATAVGRSASVTGSEGTAVGRDATAAGTGVALGKSATAVLNATALGKSANASSSSGVAVGSTSTARAASAVAIGYNAIAGDAGGANGNSVAIGQNAQVTALEGVALGSAAVATGSARAVALGAGASALGQEGVALGRTASVPAGHTGSVAVGAAVATTAAAQVAIGAKHIELTELAADPAAPAADKGRLYIKDDGAGNTILCIRTTGGVKTVTLT